MVQFGDIDIVDDSNSIKDKELPKLTPLQVKQLDYLMKEYPMLDMMTLETVLRLSDDQRDKIVDEIKSGELKHSEPLPSEDCIIQAVEVEGS